MRGTLKSIMVGDKKVIGSSSFTLKANKPSRREILSEMLRGAESIKFTGICDQFIPKQNFKVGEIYKINDTQTGLKGEAKCVSKMKGQYQFEVVGKMM